ncbi:hypothetical protein Pcinc_021755 [Petrolisthes cinctipes]|uniref:RING-type domain-containing protein n=1 Tax=Petrolisthes cinctipes TaxID=88211 RepID=A0AAE1FH15_PETCI|nr:hypothetical protein Pcinc_021755 [Petrolisthes cinctipes]
MPDLTSTQTPTVEKQHRVTSVESKSRQVTSAIKFPKVLKSLHRKPDRVHHHHKVSNYLEDLLNCPVCMEEYTPGGKGGRQPFFLTCHHSLCGMCLAKLTKTHHQAKEMREVSCPECREVTLVPPGGLTQNFYLVSLLETRAARLRRHPSVAMEGCSSHSLTHLTSVLATSTSTFSSTSARLSTLLQRRAGEQGEAAKGLRDAVVVLDAASKSLRGQLETKLEMSTLAHATAVSLLTEVDQMSTRVGNELRKDNTTTKHHNNNNNNNHNTDSSIHASSSSSSIHANTNNNKGLNRALSTPGVTKEDATTTTSKRKKHMRKSRSDLTDLVVTLNTGGIYPALTDDLNLELTCFPIPKNTTHNTTTTNTNTTTTTTSSSSSSTPSSPSLTTTSSSSRHSSCIPPPSTPSYPTFTSALPSTITSPPSTSQHNTNTNSPLSFPSFPPSKSVSLASTPTSTPPTSPYLSSFSSSSMTPSLDALTCQEQEAKILLLRKCVQALEGMEAALMDGCEDEKNREGNLIHPPLEPTSGTHLCNPTLEPTYGTHLWKPTYGNPPLELISVTHLWNPTSGNPPLEPTYGNPPLEPTSGTHLWKPTHL